MPTQAKENYLKAIYHLDQGGDEISVTVLSKEMGVSTPTVNNMIKKLHEKGWVTYQKYKPLKMTPKGRKTAALIIRKHRLAEMFLSEVMGFGWEEVHDIAEELEHIKSGKLFDRMDELLNFPTIDPHGSPIPDKDGNVLQKEYILLSNSQAGDKVRVKALANSTSDFLLYLNKKQIKLDTEMEILKIEPFDKSFSVNYGSLTDIMLSAEVCKRLLVEKI